jgi:O-antigen ligase
VPRVATVCYGVALAATSAAIAFEAVGRSLPLPWVGVWLAELALLAWAPRWPLAGVAAFLGMAYGVSSHGTLHDTLLAMRALDAVAVLAFAAWLLARRDTVAAPLATMPLLVPALALFGWVGLCLAGSAASGLPIGPFPRHGPTAFLQGAVIFVITADSLRTRQQMAAAGLILGVIVAARAALQAPDGIHLESYLATLAIVSAPLVLAGAFLARGTTIKAGFVLLAGALVGIVIAAQNRAAAVALAGAVLMAAAQFVLWGPYRRSAAIGLLATTLAAGTWLAYSGQAARFRALWDPQAHAGARLDRATASERLEIWRAGWEMALDHPVLGVGPGNFQALLPMYRPGMDPLAAHSNYVHMLAETGFVGLALYMTFFVGALLQLGRIAARYEAFEAPWPSVARLFQVALVAYLVGGTFNSRHDLVLAYAVAGGAAAVVATARRRS